MRTCINTAAAQDALLVIEVMFQDSVHHIQIHWTGSAASPTLFTQLGVHHQVKSGPTDPVLDSCSRYHNGSQPTNILAVGPRSNKKGRWDNDGYHTKKHYEFLSDSGGCSAIEQVD